MRASHLEWDGTDAAGLAQRLRALQPGLDEVSEAVAAIIAAVEDGGDEAVLDAERRFGAGSPRQLAFGHDELEAARAAIPGELLAALELAAANIERVAESEVMAELRVTLPQGQSVRLRSVPVAAAGAYAPGGNASYPSSALMCCVPARVAGVKRIVLASPAGAEGESGTPSWPRRR